MSERKKKKYQKKKVKRLEKIEKQLQELEYFELANKIQDIVVSERVKLLRLKYQQRFRG